MVKFLRTSVIRPLSSVLVHLESTRGHAWPAVDQDLVALWRKWEDIGKGAIAWKRYKQRHGSYRLASTPNSYSFFWLPPSFSGIFPFLIYFFFFLFFGFILWTHTISTAKGWIQRCRAHLYLHPHRWELKSIPQKIWPKQTPLGFHFEQAASLSPNCLRPFSNQAPCYPTLR